MQILLGLIQTGLLVWIGISIKNQHKEIVNMASEQEARLNEALNVLKGGVASLIVLVQELVANNPDLSDETAAITKLGTDIQTAIDEATGGGTLEPVAGFTAEPTSGAAPLTVQFTDTSTGMPESYSYDFGDGTTPNTEASPSHVFEAPGTYSVVQTVTNAAGSHTASVSVTVSEAIPE
jgi:hypothetical protein